jgi:hypothetical protein
VAAGELVLEEEEPFAAYSGDDRKCDEYGKGHGSKGVMP